ncbi:hypothetical protein GF359_01185 [candidate division WOR-3 bacterium]|uniref:NAD glycohydrolase translocation F5/8 type C domain-containing protein n=1 Tax=candidate division WOR-3 bacterium TaxID=2052148 RepID=A0A9D5QBP2_UNCW3|nr:hypothetical protein [candidate division WOR-3 bacterium]MBD3363808.1 hypothetical protein [candidate division WOR-3 bacterium]
MNKKPIQIIIPVLFGMAGVLSANGGPFDTSPMKGAGNARLIAKKDVTLDEEIISVTIEGDYVDVKVVYTFTNHGPSEEITYAFPIDIIPLIIGFSMVDDWEKECFPDFEISDETGELETTLLEVEDSVYVGKKFKDLIYIDFFSRRWYLTDVFFPSGKTKEISVHYRMKAGFEDWATSKSYMPGFDKRYFFYDMSPSGYWGTGTVGRLKIIVDARAEKESGTVVDELVLPWAYIEDNGIYTMEVEDLDLRTCDDITILYNNKSKKTDEFLRESRMNPNRFWGIKASSELSGQYRAANLIDGDPATVWIEGTDGTGKGEWVEFTIYDAYYFAIGVLPGYTKDSTTFTDYGACTDFKLDFYDSKDSLIHTISTRQGKEYYYPPKAIVYDWFLTYFHVGYGPLPKTGKVRLTILDARPGEDNTHTCISEVMFLSYPSYHPGEEEER